MDLSTFRWPLAVTLAYVLVYYGTMMNIAFTKARLFREYNERGEKFDRYRTQEPRMLAADRIQLNMLEHMPTFLVLFWLTAAFASPLRAAAYGGAYVVSRLVYPFVMGKELGRNIRKRVLFATVTGYLVIAAFTVELICVIGR